MSKLAENNKKVIDNAMTILGEGESYIRTKENGTFYYKKFEGNNWLEHEHNQDWYWSGLSSLKDIEEIFNSNEFWIEAIGIY